jgi:hypothetical protein
MGNQGPKEAIAAFTKGGGLTLIDGRGNVWKYDTGVTTDADGNEIVAPPSFDEVAIGPGGNRLLIVAGTTMWTYDCNTGEFAEGLDITEMLEGEDEKTTEAWKQGHNVSTRKPPDDAAAASTKSSKKKSKEYA